MKKTIVTVISLVVLLCASASAAVLNVPGEYPHVSVALDSSEIGDVVLVAPGTYIDTDTWFIREGRTVEGDSPNATDIVYTVPGLNAAFDACVFMSNGTRIANIQIGSPMSGYYTGDFIIKVYSHSENVEIENLVLYPIYNWGIYPDDGSVVSIRNLSVVGPGERGISHGYTATSSIENCYFKGLDLGILKAGLTTLTESYNSFDNCQVPCDGFDMSPTDTIGSAGIGPPDFVPEYSDTSPVIDMGDPTVNDPDLTRSDIGAVWFDQMPFLIGFDEAPGAIPVIGNPIERIFYPGDECRLCYSLTKNEGPPHLTAKSVDAYVVLNAYGTYYWWPTWSQEVDFTAFAISDGDTVTDWVFDFIWPEDTGSAYGLNFLAATTYLDDESNLIVSPVSMLEFGYAE